MDLENKVIEAATKPKLVARILELPESARYWGIKLGAMIASYVPGTIATAYFADHDYSNIENAVYSALIKAAVFMAADIPAQLYLLPERYEGKQSKKMFLSNIVVSDAVGAMINGVIGIYGHYESLEGAVDKLLKNTIGSSLSDMGMNLKNSPKIAFVLSHGIATVAGTGGMYLLERSELLRKTFAYAKNRLKK